VFIWCVLRVIALLRKPTVHQAAAPLAAPLARGAHGLQAPGQAPLNHDAHGPFEHMTKEDVQVQLLALQKLYASIQK